MNSGAALLLVSAQAFVVLAARRLIARSRRAAVAERSSREMLRTVIENSPSATAVLRGPDFEFEMVNPAYQRLAPGMPMAGRTVAQVWPSAA